MRDANGSFPSIFKAYVWICSSIRSVGFRSLTSSTHSSFLDHQQSSLRGIVSEQSCCIDLLLHTFSHGGTPIQWVHIGAVLPLCTALLEMSYIKGKVHFHWGQMSFHASADGSHQNLLLPHLIFLVSLFTSSARIFVTDPSICALLGIDGCRNSALEILKCDLHNPLCFLVREGHSHLIIHMDKVACVSEAPCVALDCLCRVHLFGYGLVVSTLLILRISPLVWSPYA